MTLKELDDACQGYATDLYRSAEHVSRAAAWLEGVPFADEIGDKINRIDASFKVLGNVSTRLELLLELVRECAVKAPLIKEVKP